jgi:polyisoprenyl-phosphate glycosyltransferase
MPKLVSIIFSFRNEEEVLDELISRTEAIMEGEMEDYELVFVNDDSSDDSLNLLTQAHHRNSRVKVLNMSRTFGVSECVIAGMAYASGDAVIYMDSDLQDPPEVIPEMLAEWRAGADIVHTVRTRREGANPVWMLVTRLGYRLISMGAIIKLVTDAGDFKLLSRRAVQQLLTLKESDPYMRGLVVWLGFPQVFVEYVRDPRGGGQSHFGLFHKNLWKTLASGITSFSFWPIYVTVGLSLAGITVAFLLLICGVAATIVGRFLPFNYWLVLLIVFCWSSLTGAVGGLGVYILRMYKDIRGRPLYIVQSALGFAHLEDSTIVAE